MGPPTKTHDLMVPPRSSRWLGSRSTGPFVFLGGGLRWINHPAMVEIAYSLRDHPLGAVRLWGTPRVPQCSRGKIAETLTFAGSGGGPRETPPNTAAQMGSIASSPVPRTAAPHTDGGPTERRKEVLLVRGPRGSESTHD